MVKRKSIIRKSKFLFLISLYLGTGGVTSCGLEESNPFSTNLPNTQEDNSLKTYDYVRIHKRLAQTLTSKQFIPDHPQDGDYLYGYLFDKKIMAQSDDDKSAENNPRNIPHLIELFDERRIQQLGSISADQNKHALLMPFESLTMGYHNYQQLTTLLEDVREKNPEITMLQSVGKSVQGRDLWLMKISDKAQIDENEPKILFVANMHGDEVVGRELMLQLIQHLMDNYGQDPTITDMINHTQIYIVPSMNPDGFELHQRFNAAGVDLNRDFPDFTSDPSETTEGRAPETKAIMELFRQHYFVVSANFHGGEVCFNLPWDTKPNQPTRNKFADDPLITSWGRAYAALNPTMIQRSGGSFDRGITYGYEWYEVDGGLQDWSIHYQDSIHGTIELSYAKWPSARDLPRFWQENRDSLLGLLNRAREGIHLEVKSSNTRNTPPAKDPKEVQLTLKGNTRKIKYDGNIIHRNALPKEILFSESSESQVPIILEAPGFEPLEISVPWGVFDGNYHQVDLTPTRPQ